MKGGEGITLLLTELVEGVKDERGNMATKTQLLKTEKQQTSILGRAYPSKHPLMLPGMYVGFVRRCPMCSIRI